MKFLGLHVAYLRLRCAYNIEFALILVEDGARQILEANKVFYCLDSSCGK